MIKLFRNVRRRLLRENRFTRYLIYAIGEIILVVIGILIALQINNWNEQRKFLKKEQQYLDRLQEDLKSDSKMYSLNIGFYKQVLEQGSFALDYTVGHELSDKDYWDLVVAFFYASQIWPVINVSPTYEELKSSGELSLIRNVELRNQLSYYYAGGRQRYNETIGINPPYRKMIRELIPFDVQEYMWEHCHKNVGEIQKFTACDPGISEAEARKIIQKIERNEVVLGELRFWMSSIKAGWVPLQEQKKLCDNILDDIQDLKTEK